MFATIMLVAEKIGEDGFVYPSYGLFATGNDPIRTNNLNKERNDTKKSLF